MQQKAWTSPRAQAPHDSVTQFEGAYRVDHTEERWRTSKAESAGLYHAPQQLARALSVKIVYDIHQNKRHQRQLDGTAVHHGVANYKNTSVQAIQRDFANALRPLWAVDAFG